MKISPNPRSFIYSIGQRGEVVACEFLLRAGYKILEKNYRCKLGEIDMIAKHDGRIVFVEVKTKTSQKFGTPQEAVDVKKQRKLFRLAAWYLKEKKLEDYPATFEVVAVLLEGDREPQIRLIPNAFEKDDKSNKDY